MELGEACARMRRRRFLYLMTGGVARRLFGSPGNAQSRYRVGAGWSQDPYLATRRALDVTVERGSGVAYAVGWVHVFSHTTDVPLIRGRVRVP